MAKPIVKLNSQGVKELLKSKEIMDACVGIAKSAASQAGDGYNSDDGYVGKTRVSAMVYPFSDSAKSDNYQNNTLLKVFGTSLKVRK